MEWQQSRRVSVLRFTVWTMRLMVNILEGGELHEKMFTRFSWGPIACNSPAMGLVFSKLPTFPVSDRSHIDMQVQLVVGDLGCLVTNWTRVGTGPDAKEPL